MSTTIERDTTAPIRKIRISCETTPSDYIEITRNDDGGAGFQMYDSHSTTWFLIDISDHDFSLLLDAMLEIRRELSNPF